MRISEFKCPYYSPDLLRRWRRRDGCQAVSDLKISYVRPPPACKFHVSPPPPAPPPVEKSDWAFDLVDSIQKVHDFFSEPRHAAPPKKKNEQPEVPPFDLQEIPDAMRKVNMPASAALMERWFAGALNFSPTEDDERALVNQDGKPYPPSMYEMSLVKLDWVLRFPRAQEAYSQLASYGKLASPHALAVLRSILSSFRHPDRAFRTLGVCNGSLIELHKRFQYQYQPVESSFSQKLKQYAHTEYASRGIPDDLTGALGSFNFYAAPDCVQFSWNGSEALIHSVLIYIKDNYTFTDTPHQDSQYLGHWNCNGMVVVPYNVLVSTLGWHLPQIGNMQPLDEIEAANLWAKPAVTLGDPRKRGNVYYPVYNSSYREWQRVHKRDGDFVIFTDYKAVELNPPIKVQF